MFEFGSVVFEDLSNDLKRYFQNLFAAFTSWCETMNHCHEVCTSNLSPDGDLQYVVSSPFRLIQEHTVFQYIFAAHTCDIALLREE